MKTVTDKKLPKPQMLSQKFFLDGSEKSMIPIIKINARDISNNRNSVKKMISLEEFSGGTGISDLTIFTIDDKILNERQRTNVKPVTSKNHILILLVLLKQKTLTLGEIMESISLKSKATVKEMLDQLIDDKMVVNDGEGYKLAHKIIKRSTENIIAIEAKVKDWKSGVRQAMRYKEYADYSYLAIYEENIQSCLVNIEVFKKLGIGLIGVSDKGIHVYQEAILSDVITIENKTLAFERLFSVIDERYQSFVAWNGFVPNYTS